jgi:hypothetical protein
MTAQTIEEAEAPVALDLLAELVRDATLRYEWRRQRPAALGQLFDDAFLLIGRLVQASGWEVSTLLSKLGCRSRSRSELETLEASDLENCIAFFQWLSDLACETPDVDVTCDLISASSRMYGHTHRDRGEREGLVACKNAIDARLGEHGIDRELTPRHVIRIGEVGMAFQFAATALPGPIGDSARDLAADNPFSKQPLVHVRTAAMEALVLYRENPLASPFGVERRSRLADHIKRCDACRAEYDAHARSLGFEPPLELSCEPLIPLTAG